MVSPEIEALTQALSRSVASTARDLGLRLQIEQASTETELARVFSGLSDSGAEALLVGRGEARGAATGSAAFDRCRPARLG